MASLCSVESERSGQFHQESRRRTSLFYHTESKREVRTFTLPTAEILSGKNDVIFKKRIKFKILKQKSGSRLEVAC